MTPLTCPSSRPFAPQPSSAGFLGASLAARQALATDDMWGFGSSFHLPSSLVSWLRWDVGASELQSRQPLLRWASVLQEGPPRGKQEQLRGLAEAAPASLDGQGISPARYTVLLVFGPETKTRLLQENSAVDPGRGLPQDSQALRCFVVGCWHSQSRSPARGVRECHGA